MGFGDGGDCGCSWLGVVDMDMLLLLLLLLLLQSPCSIWPPFPCIHVSHLYHRRDEDLDIRDEKWSLIDLRILVNQKVGDAGSLVLGLGGVLGGIPV